ncbi:hypothetical protein ACLBX9_20995 [Methylobacterium sp. A49B]|uniref:Uncharacterized protein n=1 Tax=Methylobacterium mesophilicum SR1.6/6 TaxID=908290 RepID=A0A6B9FQA2_9HYPH|nr:hypothetical protein [Methylobacterium mesophilicum]QGY04029.1 hypothetical protein MMSR116_20585 [Methylobacterium mesophilicum SR1.6/6]
MTKGRRIPKWLARRTYFKRIERWSKPDKNRRAPATSETASVPLPSNVVPFPMRMNRPERQDFNDLRDVGIA